MEEVRTSPPSILKLIAHEVRWNVLQLLAVGEYRVQDLVQLLHVPQNLISYHMRLLRQAQVVIERPSTVDERSTYYSLDLERLHTLYQSAALDLHPAIAKEIDLGPRPPTTQGPSPLRVLFLCTENSSRSQIAEALLRHLSHGHIKVYSAGSQPGECIHPFALQVLQAVKLDVQSQKPKHIESLRHLHFDYIVTLCDQMQEICPTFPGDPQRIHWSFPDPAHVEGTETVRYQAFEQTSLQLTARIRLLLTLLRYQKGYRI